MKKEETCSRFIIPALVSGMVLFTTEGFAFEVSANDLQGKICQASIQNQIEWNYKGNRKWAKGNPDNLGQRTILSNIRVICSLTHVLIALIFDDYSEQAISGIAIGVLSNTST